MTAAEAPDDYFTGAFATGPFMGIFRGYDPGETVRRCTIAWDLGITVVEVPVQSPDAMPSLLAAIEAGRDRGLGVGAGTVTSVDQLGRVRDAGAAFTVAPGLRPDVVEASLAWGIPHMPGVATSTEVGNAVALGLTWLKAFPAAQLTAGWIRAQLAPFPAVSFIATGGIDGTNAHEFLEAGARAVAVGSALEDPSQLRALAGLGLG